MLLSIMTLSKMHSAYWKFIERTETQHNDFRNDIMVFKIITLSIPTLSIKALSITEKGSYLTIMLSVVILKRENRVGPTRQSGRQGSQADKAVGRVCFRGRLLYYCPLLAFPSKWILCYLTHIEQSTFLRYLWFSLYRDKIVFKDINLSAAMVSWLRQEENCFRCKIGR